MAFMLISHGPKHLRLSSDDGHNFFFVVVTDGGMRMVRTNQVEWATGRQPADSSVVVEHASRFASQCAQAYGLL